MPGTITALAPEVQAQIKSAVQITSITDVILELVKNSLDAEAKAIYIRVDFVKGFCSVQDDGFGIPRREFLEDGGLARPYNTSKDYENRTSYGRGGRMLAAVAGMSLLSITSRCARSSSANTLLLNNSCRVASQLDLETAEHDLGRSGTKVVVHNLFGNYPVRVKYRAKLLEDGAEIAKEFESLKREIIAIILAHSKPFKLDLQEVSINRKYTHKSASTGSVSTTGTKYSLRLPHIDSTLVQAGYISRNPRTRWGAASTSSKSMSIHAAIALDPAPSKNVQFISLGQHPVPKRTFASLYESVNALFDNSTFGMQEHHEELQSTKPTAPKKDRSVHRSSHSSSYPTTFEKGADRWPMFYICIDSRTVMDFPALRDENSMGLEHSKLLNASNELIESLVLEFLQSHGYRRVKMQRRQRQLNAEDAPMQGIHRSDVANGQVPPSTARSSLVRASRDFSAEDVVLGLPFHESKRCKQQFVNDGKSLDPNGSVSSPELSETPSLPVGSDGAEFSVNAGEDHPIEWKDPRSGQTVLLNSRTGTLLPLSGQALPTRLASIAAPLVDVSRNRARKQNRVSEIAQNVDEHYSSIFFQQPQIPIPSIAPTESSISGSVTSSNCSFWMGERFGHECSSLEARLSLSEYKISKNALKHAEVLCQVDAKYILALMQPHSSEPTECSGSGDFLVLVDQHAADERCKVENLCAGVCNGRPTILTHPLLFEVNSTEAQMLEDFKSYFASWQCLYSVQPPVAPKACNGTGSIQNEQSNLMQQIRVTALPEAIAERCRLEPKHVIDMLREEIWSKNGSRKRSHCSVTSSQTSNQLEEQHSPSWIASLPSMPKKLLDMINSRACRSSIMFNDPLNMLECEELLQRLSRCVFPFQCAHGRPSILILARLDNEHGTRECLDINTNWIEQRKDLGHTDFAAERLDNKSNSDTRTGACDQVNSHFNDVGHQSMGAPSFGVLHETRFGQAFKAWKTPSTQLTQD